RPTRRIDARRRPPYEFHPGGTRLGPLNPPDHAIKLLQGLVADLQLAALAAMRDGHHESERIRETLFQRQRVGVFLAAWTARRTLAGLAGTLLHHGLGLAHAQTLVDDRLREGFRIRLAEQRTRVAGG